MPTQPEDDYEDDPEARFEDNIMFYNDLRRLKAAMEAGAPSCLDAGPYGTPDTPWDQSVEKEK